MKKLYFLIAAILLLGCNAARLNNSSKNFGFKPYDAIIVPGVPYYHDSISDIFKLRVKWSIYMYQNGFTKNIIYSGADVHSPYCESKVMSLIAQQNGIPKNVIFCDTIAQHGTENIYYGYLLGKEQGFNRIALCTDPFQSELLSFFTAKMTRKFKIKGGFEVMDIILSEIKNMPLDVSNVADSTTINPNHVPLNKKKTRSEMFFGSTGGNILWKD